MRQNTNLSLCSQLFCTHIYHPDFHTLTLCELFPVSKSASLCFPYLNFNPILFLIGHPLWGFDSQEVVAEYEPAIGWYFSWNSPPLLLFLCYHFARIPLLYPQLSTARDNCDWIKEMQCNFPLYQNDNGFTQSSTKTKCGYRSGYARLPLVQPWRVVLYWRHSSSGKQTSTQQHWYQTVTEH